MTDYGLDLAVIGNGRTAALLEPSSRIVWWCLPRYDGEAAWIGHAVKSFGQTPQDAHPISAGRLIAVVHAETSTGVENDVAPLRA